jgi:CO dehydrogenase/acetyl-CoA synthase epsilon subunit
MSEHLLIDRDFAKHTRYSLPVGDLTKKMYYTELLKNIKEQEHAYVNP